MRINHNIPAMNAHRILGQNSSIAAKNLERLSSGKKINRASDDAAGMAISEKMNAQIRGLQMASRNSLDGVSLVQTAEGAMNEVHSMLQRMRELSVQAANGTMDTGDRDAIQAEINQLTSEINRIGNGTEFNKLKILQGNQEPKSNTQYSAMSTGKPAEFILDKTTTAAPLPTLSTPFQKISETDTLIVTVNGKENVVNLQGFNSTTNLTYSDFLERINDALGDDGKAFFNDKMQVVVRTNDTGGNKSVKFEGTATSKLATTAPTALIVGTAAATVFDYSGGGTKTFKINTKTITLDANYTDIAGLVSAINTKIAADTDLQKLGITFSQAGGVISISATSPVDLKLEAGATDALGDLKLTAGDYLTQASESFGKAENPANYSTGYFKFESIPEKGSFIKIGDKTLDFYDSSKEPYMGTNIPINIYNSAGPGYKNVSDIVSEISKLGIRGISMFVGDNSAGQNLPSPLPTDFPTKFNNNNKTELIVVAHERGFGGNAIALEGTLEEFNVNLQVGANAGQGFRMEIGDIRSQKLKISADKPTGNPGVKGASYTSIKSVNNGITSNLEEYAVDVTDEKKATAAIEVFNNAIVQLATERSRLGAIQNRLEKTIANLDNTAENLTAAMSRIVDTDMASEMSEFTKMNILQQAGTSMLAQANQQPQLVLKLLGN